MAERCNEYLGAGRAEPAIRVLIVGARHASENGVVRLLSKLVAANIDFVYAQGLYQGLSHGADGSLYAVLADISDNTGLGANDLATLATTYLHRPLLALDNRHRERTASRALQCGANGYLAHEYLSATELRTSLVDLCQYFQSTQQQAQESRYDDLTGLANERAFCRTLDTALKYNDPERPTIAVLALLFDKPAPLAQEADLAPNPLLTAIARRLERHLRETDLVARHSQGHFVILLRHLQDENDAVIVAEKLIEQMQPAFLADNQPRHVAINIGIAFPSVAHQSALELIEAAANAAYAARQQGPNHFLCHSNEQTAQTSLNLRSQLQQAMAQGQFCLLYQPLVDIRSDRIIAIEALLRWRIDPTTLLTPAQFMQHIDQSRHSTRMAHWVIDSACHQLAQWQQQGVDGAVISLNLSYKQFTDPALPSAIESALIKYALAPQRIMLEVSEAALRKHAGQSEEIIEQLKRLGVALVIDDFGAGGCSLHTLSNFKVDGIKIDGSLINTALHCDTSAALVDALISACHHLGLGVTAEAVENKDQFDYLKDRDCDSYQGFFFSQPLAAGELSSFFSPSMR